MSHPQNGKRAGSFKVAKLPPKTGPLAKPNDPLLLMARKGA